MTMELLTQTEQHPVATLGAVQGDWLAGTATAYVAQTRWKGQWAIPYFTLEMGLDLAARLPYLHFDAARDAFVAHWDGHTEVFAASTLVVQGRTLTVYGIGARAWCWELSHVPATPGQRQAR